MAWYSKHRGVEAEPGRSDRMYKTNGGGYICEESEEISDEYESEDNDCGLNSEHDESDNEQHSEEGDESAPEPNEEQPKRLCIDRVSQSTPVSSNTSRKRGGESVQHTKVTPCGERAQNSCNVRATQSLSVGHTPVHRKNASTHPKVLDMDSQRCQDESISTVLGNITNMLGTVIERLNKTESKLESMERKLNTPSSSAGSGADERKRRVPTAVRTETRKVYKTLLDDDEFTGFDLSAETTYKDSVNQNVSSALVKEVGAHNPSFSASDVRAAAYTYYTSLCQDEAQKRKGIYAQRKIQRRRRERVVRRRAERESQFKKMSYSDADQVKWKKILVTEFMSSDESCEEDGRAVFIVKKLPWRSERVSKFFERLDEACTSRKTEQASRQTKPRIRNDFLSSRPAPRGFPSWAVI